MTEQGIAAIPISAVILTKNEAKNISEAIASVRPYVEQVLVLDSDSDDETVAIAMQAGARVVNFRWNGAYPKKKECSLQIEGLTNDWVLQLDADERPSREFFSEVAKVLGSSRREEFGAIDVPITYYFRGVKLRHGATVHKRALVHRQRIEFPIIDDLAAPGAGEVEGHYQPLVRKPWTAGRTRARIEHRDNDSVSSWFARHHRYADWEAWNQLNPNVRSQTRKAKSGQGALFDRMPLKPLVFFVYCYIVRRGFLDGVAGLDYALALSFFRWQVDVRVREGRSRSC